MADKSGIEWCNATWNPLVGCKAVSPGCDNCYAARDSSGRLAHLPLYAGLASKGVFTGEIRTVPSRLDQPLRWKKPRRIFVNSMSDLFHPDVTDQFIADVFTVMHKASQHTFQILTKRPQRMAQWATENYPFGVPPHIWLGTSIELDKYTFRANYVRDTPAMVRFLSLEPLLGPLPSLDLTKIDWVIVGGESGPRARPTSVSWVRDIRDRCVEAKVPFLMKQWGEWCPDFELNDDQSWTQSDDSMTRLGKKAAGRTLDNKVWDEYPG